MGVINFRQSLTLIISDTTGRLFKEIIINQNVSTPNVTFNFPTIEVG